MPPDRDKIALWRQALEQGVAGELCDALIRDHHARYGAPPRLLAALLRPSRLSPREREVLSLAGEGLSVRETARRLHIEFETAKWHRRRILVKLSANNIGHAYAIAVRSGSL